MKKTRFLFITLIFVAAASPALAGDVHVNGYFRKDGTYVQPYTRSAPDNTISNNYGRPQYPSQPPSQRDSDHDGLPNYLDKDDNNNGIWDDSDRK